MSKNIFSGVSVVVSVGSVDGVCTTAAVLRNGAVGAKVVFTQAFAVDKLDPKAWGEPGQHVLFVDLAVNNKEPGMTVAFLRRVAEAGHVIVGVLDEHDGEAWATACSEAGLNFSAMEIQPVTGKGTETNSSGALLASLLGEEADSHTVELCAAADAGDRMDFTTHFGGMVNSAVKSKISDDNRRVKLARHLAEHREADSEIQGWISEYDKILATHKEVVAAREDLGDGIIKVSTVGKVVDITALMAELYKLGKVVLVDGEVFSPATKQKERSSSFGCTPKAGLDLLTALKTAGINAGGFAQKANVAPEDEAKALEVVRKLLQG